MINKLSVEAVKKEKVIGYRIVGIFFKSLKYAEKYAEQRDVIRPIMKPRPKKSEILVTAKGYLVVSGEVYNKYFKK